MSSVKKEKHTFASFLLKLPKQTGDALLFGPERGDALADTTARMKIARAANYIYGLAVIFAVFLTACKSIFLAVS